MNELVTIPKAEYLRLKAIEEDMSDLRSANEVLQRIKAGAEELISSEVVVRLLNGEPPLAVWRNYRHLYQTDLARQSGVNRIQIMVALSILRDSFNRLLRVTGQDFIE